MQDSSDHTDKKDEIKNKLLRSKIFFQPLDIIIESCEGAVEQTSSKGKKQSRAEMYNGIIVKVLCLRLCETCLTLEEYNYE